MLFFVLFTIILKDFSLKSKKHCVFSRLYDLFNLKICTNHEAKLFNVGVFTMPKFYTRVPFII